MAGCFRLAVPCVLSLSAAVGFAQQPPRLDLHGNPLPRGAAARLGAPGFVSPSPIRDLELSPDGKTFATLGDDRIVRLWSMRGKILRELKPVAWRLHAIAFSSDGKQLAVGGWDGFTRGTVDVWNVETGEL
ncbi:MAG: hypothetical protein N2C14_14590, partial [Planctomycetales bacterium]